MKHDLKECPFCGAPAQTREEHIDPDSPSAGTNIVIACGGQDCPPYPILRMKEREKAIATWNQRIGERHDQKE